MKEIVETFTRKGDSRALRIATATVDVRSLLLADTKFDSRVKPFKLNPHHLPSKDKIPHQPAHQSQLQNKPHKYALQDAIHRILSQRTIRVSNKKLNSYLVDWVLNCYGKFNAPWESKSKMGEKDNQNERITEAKWGSEKKRSMQDGPVAG